MNRIIIFFILILSTSSVVAQERTLRINLDEIDDFTIFRDTNVASIVLLNCSSLNDIPDGFFDMTWLRSVSIYFKFQKAEIEKKETLGLKFANFLKLDSLSIHGRQLTSIDENLNVLKLKYLNLSFTSLEEIPVFLFSNCLIEIVLENNVKLNLDNLNVSTAPNIIYLRLNNSKLETLHESIYGLKHLEVLECDVTDIVEVPNNILKLKNLRILRLLTMTGIEKIPSNLCKLEKLEVVSIFYRGDTKLCIEENIKWQENDWEYKRLK